MMRILILLGSFLLLFGCESRPDKTPNLEGDLYYTAFRLGSFYDQPDSLYNHYIKLKDSLGMGQLKKEDPVLMTKIELLEKRELIKSPYIYLKTDSDSTFIVYMSKEDYEPITQYTHQDLIDNHQKIRLKLDTEKLTDKLLLCKSVISIKLVDGETQQRGGKFLIEDYR